MMWNVIPWRALAAAVFFAVMAAHQGFAQPASGAVSTEATLDTMTRVESWRFFEPPPAEGRPDYTFAGNRGHLGVRVRAPRFDLAGGFAYTAIVNLPRMAVGGQGPMGTGALYQAATGQRTSYQLYFDELNVTAHTADRGVRVTIGRMTHTSGAEGERPAVDAVDAALGALRRLRLDARLVGGFDWSFYRRRFDGARLTIDRPDWYAGGAVLLPTQGGFEESANLTMTDVRIGMLFAGRRHQSSARAGGAASRGETQAFLHTYHDSRDVKARPDGSRAAGAVDVTIVVGGASHAGVRRTGVGRIDWLAWGALQGGDWYGQPHRAWSGAVEAGHRWSGVPWTPWIRAGISRASGDDDPSDDRHGTFFPVLPSTRTYALSTVYAQMNLRDAFLQAFAEPRRDTRVRLELHRLDLATAADGWYQGSGASASDGPGFGYARRPSGGHRGLGTALDAAVDVALTPYWSVNAYLGRMWGGPIVRHLFAGDRLTYWYVENVLRFRLSGGT